MPYNYYQIVFTFSLPTDGVLIKTPFVQLLMIKNILHLF